MYSVQKYVYIFTKSPETLFIHQYSVYVEKKYAPYTTEYISTLHYFFLVYTRSNSTTQQVCYRKSQEYVGVRYDLEVHTQSLGTALYISTYLLLCRETLLNNGSIRTMKEKSKHRWRAMQLHMSLKTNFTKINAKVVVS